MEDKFKIIKLLNKKDKRGSLFEIIRLSDIGIKDRGCLFFSTINHNERRGDHYHKHKKMWFTCVHGEVIVLLEDTKGNKKRFKINSINPKVIFCEPEIARALYNKKPDPAIIVWFSSTENDKNKPDVYKKYINYEKN